VSGHDLGQLFAALADDTRREILGLLAGTGDQSATRLAQRLPISRQAVVKHLMALEAVGTVRRLRHGREILFRVDPGPLRVAARWFERTAHDWDARLEALKRAAEVGE
jgi:DNA-binding transcriptional ArsR family regulator